MKKNLIFSMIAGLLLTGLLSFTLIKNNSGRTHTFKKTMNIKANKLGCSCVIQNLVTNGNGVFSWSVTGGTPDHYNYGGYYQAGGNFSGTAYSTNITIPYKTGGGRFGVTPVCADGTSGTGANILFN